MFDQITTFLTRLFKPNLKSCSEEKLWNFCLKLALEWGDNCGKPINDRLEKAYPHMESKKIIELNNLAQETMTSSNNSVYNLAEQYGRKLTFKLWVNNFLENYPWVDKRNCNRLFLIGEYIAMHDGLL